MDWAAVKSFLAGLETQDEQKAAWKHMLTALGQPPQDQNNKPFFAFADVIVLNKTDLVTAEQLDEEIFNPKMPTLEDLQKEMPKPSATPTPDDRA
jgi:G3E family GTPase